MKKNKVEAHAIHFLALRPLPDSKFGLRPSTPLYISEANKYVKYINRLKHL